MKTLLALFLAVSVPVAAQAISHTATFPYTASPDSTATIPGTVDIYRANGLCTTSGLTFSKVNPTPQPPSGTYTDTLPGVGSYCYYLIAIINGTSSNPSSTGGGTALPFAPTLGSITVK